MEHSEMTVDYFPAEALVHSAFNGIDYLFSNLSSHKGTKSTKESKLPSIPLCPSCLCAKHPLCHWRQGVRDSGVRRNDGFRTS